MVAQFNNHCKVCQVVAQREQPLIATNKIYHLTFNLKLNKYYKNTEKNLNDPETIVN